MAGFRSFAQCRTCRVVLAAGITAPTTSFLPIATDQDIELARDLFAALDGEFVMVEEPQMDAITALSGCGPAYVYLIIEALADAGVSLGLSRTLSLELVAQTLLGSAALVLASGVHPAALRDEVATPDGCTIDGLLALEAGKLRSTLVQAVAAAASRSALLSSKVRIDSERSRIRRVDLRWSSMTSTLRSRV